MEIESEGTKIEGKVRRGGRGMGRAEQLGDDERTRRVEESDDAFSDSG